MNIHYNENNQTGTCLPDGGGCEVKKVIEVRISGDSPSYSAILTTDRNDGQDQFYYGLDFELLYVKSCPVEALSCEDQGGRCDETTGNFCICENGQPCGCACGVSPQPEGKLPILKAFHIMNNCNHNTDLSSKLLNFKS